MSGLNELIAGYTTRLDQGAEPDEAFTIALVLEVESSLVDLLREAVDLLVEHDRVDLEEVEG